MAKAKKKKPVNPGPGKESDENHISKKAFLRGIVIGILISILISILSWMGFLKNWENRAFDFMMWWSKEERSTDIFLIEIDDNDYNQLFNSTSPLSRKKLSEIILKIAKARPKVIAIDIELGDVTSEDKYLIDALRNINQIPIVLPVSLKRETVDNRKTFYTSSRFFYNLPGNILFGAIDYPVSKDGVIRDMFTAREIGEGKVSTFFPLSIIAAVEGYNWEELSIDVNMSFYEEDYEIKKKGKVQSLLEDIQHTFVQRIQYIGNKNSFNNIKSSYVYKTPEEVFQPGNIFTDKIVIIGGTFENGRDFHMTPKGVMSGAAIIANSVETLLDMKPLKPVNHIFELLIELGIVFILSYYFLRFSPFKATIIGLISILPLAIIGSGVAFATLNRWLNFIPIGVAVLLHGQYSLVEHYSRYKKENAQLKSLLKEKDREICQLNKELKQYKQEKYNEEKAQ
ncbi:MAG: CHASE2 domain-containing protein [Candidatus Aminicenantes bacterium]|jgi:CHASE2 domain-containing sensor protein